VSTLDRSEGVEPVRRVPDRSPENASPPRTKPHRPRRTAAMSISPSKVPTLKAFDHLRAEIVNGTLKLNFESFVHSGDKTTTDLVLTATGFDLGGTGHYAYGAQATDIDGDTLTYSLVSAPTGAHIDRYRTHYVPDPNGQLRLHRRGERPSVASRGNAHGCASPSPSPSPGPAGGQRPLRHPERVQSTIQRALRPRHDQPVRRPGRELGSSGHRHHRRHRHPGQRLSGSGRGSGRLHLRQDRRAVRPGNYNVTSRAINGLRWVLTATTTGAPARTTPARSPSPRLPY